MKILGPFVFLLLLGGLWCQNNRNAKATGKSAKKSSGIQQGDAGQSASAADVTSGSTGRTGSTSRNTGGSAESRQEGAAGTRGAGQQTDDMRLHYLTNTQVTCNDGTVAGFYLKEFRGSRRWLLFLEGGWCCYSRETCDYRYQNIPRLMSSSGWPETKRGSGILSSKAEDNPHWHNANIVDKVRDRNINATEYNFMGSLIIREVIKDLIPKGIKQAKVVMLSGSSAGGTGVLLNIARVASQLQQLGAEAQVRGLVDSGWFLESKQQRSPNCPETVSCSPEDAIKIGLRLWNGVVPDRCRQLFKRGEEWKCFFGHRLYSTLTSPVFIVQWLFDEEQLRNLSYIDVQTLLTLAEHKNCINWTSFQVRGTSLPRALQCWDRSLEAIRNNRTPAKGCPFHLVDSCQWPQCNPTCPALVDKTTQQELTLLQMLVAMGLDLQRLGLDPQGDADSLVSMVRNGG
uniref:Notum pectinacetylesterase 2 n=1 Tax=Neolamprologus brichardi TaxID=32507 RepID=A0A3Q4I9Q4_NEOBR